MARPRDPELGRRILAAAAALLGDRGVHELTFESVAERAGTSRPAIYRRYGSLDELVVAALGELATGSRVERSGDHLADLERELADFRDALVRLRSINVVASILLDDTDEQVKAAYREHVVGPRRARLRAILESAVADGLLHPDGPADVDVAVSLGPGSWYAHALAGSDPPGDWPAVVARLVWRALGGAVAV